MESKRPLENNNILFQLRDRLSSSPEAFSDIVAAIVAEFNKDDVRTWLLDVLKNYADQSSWKTLLDDLTDLHNIKCKIMQCEAEGVLSLRHIPVELKKIYPISCRAAEHLALLQIDEKNAEQVKDFILAVALLLARKEKNIIDDNRDPSKTERMKGYTDNRSRQDMFEATIYRSLVAIVNQYPAVRSSIPVQVIPGQNEQEFIAAMRSLDAKSELRFKHYFILKYLPKQVEQLPDYKTILDPEARHKVQLDKKEKLLVLNEQADSINQSVPALSPAEINQLSQIMGGAKHIKSETVLNEIRNSELEYEQSIKRINEAESKEMESFWDWIPAFKYLQTPSSEKECERQGVIASYQEKKARLQKRLDDCMRYELKIFYASNVTGYDYRTQLYSKFLGVMYDLQETRIQKAFDTTFHVYKGVNAAGEPGQKREFKYYFMGVPEYHGASNKLLHQGLYALNCFLYFCGLFLLIPLKNTIKFFIEYGPKRLEAYFENRMENAGLKSTYLFAAIGYGVARLGWIIGRTITSPFTSCFAVIKWSGTKIIQCVSWIKTNNHRSADVHVEPDRSTQPVSVKSSHASLHEMGGLMSHTAELTVPLKMSTSMTDESMPASLSFTPINQGACLDKKLSM